jgi:hypothetical protein
MASSFKPGVVKRFRGGYMFYIVTAEIQTANVAYFQRKIQLSRFSAYPDGSPSRLIRISGVLLYFIFVLKHSGSPNWPLPNEVTLEVGYIFQFLAGTGKRKVTDLHMNI